MWSWLLLLGCEGEAVAGGHDTHHDPANVVFGKALGQRFK
ncbi:hypothetical protein SJ05684_c30150 [Sinorhizobium sojae CCBAU 05684]|uniref:Uncharacterized protein n=1 Tax=Sinorhizobium sojae CCBAU 05684 TaxID=716928 RepID=A0A249PGN7_9HYPH|nr:hypothetical protein SJ05684_c30150 [Sinorhizobium sojae CCBAU 05684]